MNRYLLVIQGTPKSRSDFLWAYRDLIPGMPYQEQSAPLEVKEQSILADTDESARLKAQDIVDAYGEKLDAWNWTSISTILYKPLEEISYKPSPSAGKQTLLPP